MDSRFLDDDAEDEKAQNEEAQGGAAEHQQAWGQEPPKDPAVEHKERLNYLKSIRPVRKDTPKWVWLVIGLALAILLGGGIWQLTHHKSKVTPAKSSNSAIKDQPAPANSSASGSTHYISPAEALNLEFDYPSDWQVSPAQSANTSRSQAITITSPSTTITSADGSSTTGKVVVTIRSASSQISELSTTTATAAQDSVQIGYKKPTSSQHQYPYVTFLHFTKGAVTAGAFEETVITGVSQFTKGMTINADSLSGIDPLITASFYKCNTTDCEDNSGGILSISSGTWQNDSLFKQTVNIFESFQLH